VVHPSDLATCGLDNGVHVDLVFSDLLQLVVTLLWLTQSTSTIPYTAMGRLLMRAGVDYWTAD